MYLDPQTTRKKGLLHIFAATAFFNIGIGTLFPTIRKADRRVLKSTVLVPRAFVSMISRSLSRIFRSSYPAHRVFFSACQSIYVRCSETRAIEICDRSDGHRAIESEFARHGVRGPHGAGDHRVPQGEVLQGGRKFERSLR